MNASFSLPHTCHILKNISLKLPKCDHVFQINGLKDPKEVTCIPLNILFEPEASLTRLRLTEEQSSGSETKIRLNQLRGRLIPNTARLQHPITSNILTGLLLQGISFNFERYRCMCDLFTVYSCFMDQGVTREWLCYTISFTTSIHPNKGTSIAGRGVGEPNSDRRKGGCVNDILTWGGGP